MPIETLELQENVPLASYTTLRIGGAARYFCEVRSEAGLQVAIGIAAERGLKVFVLGGGSNLLVSDAGFDGLVIHSAFGGEIRTADADGHLLAFVPAGVDWDDFVRHICEQGISGVECMAGIPGLVGGSPIQNIGAYGQEVASSIESVRAFDLQSHTFVDLPSSECGFGYRSSIFNTTQRGRYIVTEVAFRFDRGAKPNLSYADLAQYFAGAATPPAPLDVYHAVREIRHRKGMLLVDGEPDCRSAGSFFKNPIVPAAILGYIAETLKIDPTNIPHWPVPDTGRPNSSKIKLPAAWVLERAGFHKGYTLGEAGISSRHTLALINRGNATAADLIQLRDLIQAEVKNRFGIDLEQEPVAVGF